MIKRNDQILIKKGLKPRLELLNYETNVIDYYINKFENTKQIVEGVWYNRGQYFVVVDGCCNIPIQACKKIK